MLADDYMNISSKLIIFILYWYTVYSVIDKAALSKSPPYNQ